MSDATKFEQLLKDIQTVDIENMLALEALDAKIWCWLEGIKFIKPVYFTQHPSKKRVCRGYRTSIGDISSFLDRPWIEGLDWKYRRGKYSTSRDALKRLRPEGWKFRYTESFTDDMIYCCLERSIPPVEDKTNTTFQSFSTMASKTEELAELYVIIQAINWERENV